MRVWRMSLRRTESTIISWHGSYVKGHNRSLGKPAHAHSLIRAFVVCINKIGNYRKNQTESRLTISGPIDWLHICFERSLTAKLQYKNLSWMWGGDSKIRPRVTVWNHEALPTDAIVILKDRFFYPHQTTMIDFFSGISFDLQHLILT